MEILTDYPDYRWLYRKLTQQMKMLTLFVMHHSWKAYLCHVTV